MAPLLANRSPYSAELDWLLERREPVGHDLILGELVIGDPGGREDLFRWYTMTTRIPDVRHEEAVEFVRAHKLFGRGISWIGAHLLASCRIAGVPLWTADQRLAGLAEELGINYDSSH